MTSITLPESPEVIETEISTCNISEQDDLSEIDEGGKSGVDKEKPDEEKKV